MDIPNYNMASVATTNWSDDSSLAGWWIVACLSAAGLVLLWASLVQQIDLVSNSIGSAFAVKPKQAEWLEPTRFVRSENNQPIPAVDGVGAASTAKDLLESPVIATSTITEPENIEESVSPTPIEELATPVEAVPVESVAIAAQVEAIEEKATEVESIEGTAADRPFVPVDPIDPTASKVSIDSIEAEEQPEQIESALTEGPVEQAEVQTQVLQTEIRSNLELTESVVPNDVEALQSASVELESASDPEVEPESSLATLRRSALFELNIRSKGIKFEAGEIRLTDQSEVVLQQIFEDLFLYSESDIVIEVASQDAIDGTSNDTLAAQRAAMLKTFLAERGIDENRLVLSVLPDSAVPTEAQHVSIEAKIDE